MTAYRISKYRVGRENSPGLNSDWTSVTDIGRTFNGARLTARRYLEVERSYLSMILTAFVLGGEHEFRLEDLEGSAKDLKEAHSLARKSGLDAISIFPYAWLNRSSLPIGLLPDVARLILREHIWARVIGQRGTRLDFGYDYYCYLSGRNISSKLLKLASCLGLSVETIKASPYEVSKDRQIVR
jgi:hypothetical protein